MKLENLTKLRDKRTDCFSIIQEVSIKDYLGLIFQIYKDKGGIKEQREPLKSSSAMRIRKQMVKDIRAGTILPPIVLGLIISDDQFKSIPGISNNELAKLLSDAKPGDLTIIDGMQRTTALIEADQEDSGIDISIRVEFWISTRLNSLIYRMLVLNTGQVPWNLRRQVETVFSSMINEMRINIPEMDVIRIDEPARRSRGGQYHANDLIELYLAFGGRKEKVDTRERLADEFTRLDFIEATEFSSFSDIFYASLKFMTLMDIEISRFQVKDVQDRFVSGKDLFTSQPARVGFVTAFAKKVYGRPGFERSQSEVVQSYNSLKSEMEALIVRLRAMDTVELGAFLALDTLTEKLSKKSSRVGDFEREYFTKAFDTLVEDTSEIPSMLICWLAF